MSNGNADFYKACPRRFSISKVSGPAALLFGKQPPVRSAGCPVVNSEQNRDIGLKALLTK
jgi:hypothetical protein